MAHVSGFSTSLDRRLIIFFDWCNFYSGYKDLDVEIPPHAIVRLLEHNLRCKMSYKGYPELVRTYMYFTAFPESHPNCGSQKVITDHLESERVSRIETRFGRLGNKIEEKVTCTKCDHKFKAKALGQKGVDVNIAADMVDLAYKNAFDSAILVSGDSDFVPAIQYVKSLGKIVGVASFRNRVSEEQEIMKIADVRIYLDEFLNEKDLFLKKV